MTEDSGRSGICRSKVGVAEIEDPWTKRIVPCRPAPDAGARRRLRHKNSRTLSLPTTLVVQCSVPMTLARFDGCGGAARASPSASRGVATSAAAVEVKKSRRDTDMVFSGLMKFTLREKLPTGASVSETYLPDNIIP